MIGVAGAGFAIGLFTLIIGLIFGCCRACNKCGGKKARQGIWNDSLSGGYRRRSVVMISIFFVIFSTLILFSGGMTFTHSANFTIQLGKTKTSMDALVGNATALLDRIPAIANEVENSNARLKPLLLATLVPDLIKLLDKSVGNWVRNINTQLEKLYMITNDLKGNLTLAKGKVDSLKTEFAVAESIVADVKKLNSITIQSKSYTPNAPNVDKITPDLTSLPDFNLLANQVGNLPNASALSIDATDKYRATETNVTKTVNATIASSIISPGMTTQMKDLSAQMKKTIGDPYNLFSKLYDAYVSPNESLRGDITKIHLFVIFAPYILGIIGIVFRRRKFFTL